MKLDWLCILPFMAIGRYLQRNTIKCGINRGQLLEYKLDKFIFIKWATRAHLIYLAFSAIVSSVCFPFNLPCFNNRPAARLSMIAFLSLSSFSFTITTFEGWIPTNTVAPFAFSRTILSMWMTYLLLYA